MTIPGREIHWHRTLDTTMREAARLAAAGCDSGVVVGADEQTAGQGRLGRSWHSESDSGLYFTVILRPRIDLRAVPIVTLALGIGVHDAIGLVSGVECDLRWPNDVLTGGRKIAGILAVLEGNAVLAGIDINVNHAGFPADIADSASSLRIARF